MQITVPLDLVAIVKRLPLREKLRLVRQLEQDTWSAQLDAVVTRIRRRRSIQQLSANDIARIVEDVRSTRHGRSLRRP